MTPSCFDRHQPKDIVIARLDRAIQKSLQRTGLLDAPVKPGHDGGWNLWSPE